MSFDVRDATETDLPELLRLRAERQDEYLAHEPRMPSHAKSADTWGAALAEWLAREDCRVVVAARGEGLIGYMIGWAWQQPPFVGDGPLGLISEMSVDGHCKQGGVGRALFSALADWFRAQGITAIEARAPHRHPIEQAFWRASGAEGFVSHFYVALADPPQEP
ncbi:MAG: N-acetyltransferase family protein [Anaerolineales bacterium]